MNHIVEKLNHLREIDETPVVWVIPSLDHGTVLVRNRLPLGDGQQLFHFLFVSQRLFLESRVVGILEGRKYCPDLLARNEFNFSWFFFFISFFNQVRSRIPLSSWFCEFVGTWREQRIEEYTALAPIINTDENFNFFLFIVWRKI